MLTVMIVPPSDVSFAISADETHKVKELYESIANILNQDTNTFLLLHDGFPMMAMDWPLKSYGITNLENIKLIFKEVRLKILILPRKKRKILLRTQRVLVRKALLNLMLKSCLLLRF